MQILDQGNEILGLRSLESEIFNNFDSTVLSLVGQRGLAGQGLHLLVQLEAVVAGTGTEDAATTMEQRRLDVTVTGTAATLLATELLGRASDFTSLFSLVGSLALVGQELLNIEINGMRF